MRRVIFAVMLAVTTLAAFETVAVKGAVAAKSAP